MLMYLTSEFRGSVIEAKSVERATESSVWVNGCRSARTGGYHAYHDTWEAARDHLLGKAERMLEAANKNQVKAANMLAAVRRLTPPTA